MRANNPLPPPPPPPLSLFPTRILDLTKIGSMTTEMDLGAPLALMLGLGVRQARLLALLSPLNAKAPAAALLRCSPIPTLLLI